MASHRFAVVIATILITIIAGCGKKSGKSTESNEPVTPAPAPGPGPATPSIKGKKDPTKPDFDIMLSEMRMTAGKPKTDVRPSGSTTLSQFTSTFPPSHERRAEAYAAFVETAGKVVAKERAQYLYWAARYAGKENVADLLTIAREYAVDVKTSATSSAAFTRLAELKEPSTFPALAAMLSDKVGLVTLESKAALKAIGTPAEKAVQPYATPTGPGGKANDFLLRASAVEILGGIGTVDSLPLLQSLYKDNATTIADAAKKAVADIQSRAK